MSLNNIFFPLSAVNGTERGHDPVKTLFMWSNKMENQHIWFFCYYGWNLRQSVTRCTASSRSSDHQPAALELPMTSTEQRILLAPQRQSSVDTRETTFARVQSCKPEVKQKQRCQKCGQTDVILSEQMHFQNRSFVHKNNCRKWALLLSFRGRWATHMGVVSMKSQTLGRF